jgi:hypothetical protein
LIHWHVANRRELWLGKLIRQRVRVIVCVFISWRTSDRQREQESCWLGIYNIKSDQAAESTIYRKVAAFILNITRQRFSNSLDLVNVVMESGPACGRISG